MATASFVYENVEHRALVAEDGQGLVAPCGTRLSDPLKWLKWIKAGKPSSPQARAKDRDPTEEFDLYGGIDALLELAQKSR